MKPSEIVDYLTYVNYRHNRQISPAVTVEQWEKIYGPNVHKMEAKFQEEAAQ